MKIVKEEKSTGQNRDENYFKALYILIIVLSLLILSISLNRFFGHDEFEHIHSAWYIEQGYTPYVDFFQSHHPLLWFLMVPFIKLAGHSVSAIIILRLFMLVFTGGIVIMVYRLARLATRSKEVALLAVVFLLSLVLFVEKGVEIRPDVPQVFFGLLALYFFLASFPPDFRRPLFIRQKWREICLSACCASLSFLFLQKSIFLVAAFGIILLFRLIKREITWKAVALFAFYFSLPLLLFAGYLLVSHSFSDYLLTNWLFHLRHIKSFFPASILLNTLVQNPVFWIFSSGAVILFLSGKNKNRELRLIAGLALFLFLSVFFMKHPYRQYFLLPLSLLSITAAYFAKLLFFKFQCLSKRKIAALLLFVLVPFFFLCSMVFQSNRGQLARIRFVLENTKISDPVYDGDIQFNLFRPDLHYFWYSIRNGGMRTYNRISGNKFADYDVVELIRRKKPKFISNVGINMSVGGARNPGCQQAMLVSGKNSSQKNNIFTHSRIEGSKLNRIYKKTPHKNLYINKKYSAQIDSEK
ncbi:MAG: glycosyltransferase family 39 protein [Candidatus Aminicenantes bacterium]|nr:glycosyltransferase family 39 protein [Candidatus Aminicenantes bacterium]